MASFFAVFAAFFLYVVGANVGTAGGGLHFLCASRRDSEAGALSVEQLERLYQHLKNAPPFSVVRLPVELPFEAPVDAGFVYYRSRRCLVAANITPAQDARNVIAHKVIGHFGKTGFFGLNLAAVLGVVHGAKPRVRIISVEVAAR